MAGERGDQFQERHRTKIKSKLDAQEKPSGGLGDPLLLLEIDGFEGISRLSSYRLTLARPRPWERVEPLEPAKLIGSVAYISTHLTMTLAHADASSYIARAGIFHSFTQASQDEDLISFRAELVPAFEMMKRETLFRIFENKDAVDILNSIFDEWKPLGIDSDLTRLKKDPKKFPVMEYCAQFGETTFNFVTRLMARFNIFYYFDHSKIDPDEQQSPLKPETLVLQQIADGNKFLDCKVPFGGLAGNPLAPSFDKVVAIQGKPSVYAAAGLQHNFSATVHRNAVGDFNRLQPTSPFAGEALIDPEHDLFQGNQEVDKRSDTMLFAPPLAPLSNNDMATAYAGTRMGESEGRSEVRTIAGMSRNPTFFAGAKFNLLFPGGKSSPDSGGQSDVSGQDLDFLQKETGQPAEDSEEVIIVFLHISAYDHSYTAAHRGFFATLLHVLGGMLTAILPIDLKTPLSFAETTVATGLNNNWKSWIQSAVASDGKSLDPSAIVKAASLANLSSAAPLLVQSLIKSIEAEKPDTNNEYANAFVGLPKTQAIPLPLPQDWTQPIVYGPHLAVVIGDDGSDTKKADILADAIGRVRVRFPWDLKRGEHSGDQFKRGDATCWVRISEGWAGRHYGTQFLPRIGQEVIVSFINGDPDRPIITGRVYNADTTITNLPFPHPSVEKTPLKNHGDTSVENAKELPETKNVDLPLSGIKTWSIPTTKPSGDPDTTRFQLLRFSDKRNHEQYLIRAQHRLDITAFSRRFESIGSDRHLTVGGKDTDAEPPEIGGDYITHVFGDYHLHVGDPDFYKQTGNRYTLIENNDQLKVMGDAEESVNGNWSTFAGNQATLTSSALGGTIVLWTGGNITLTVGASSIVITPAGISITAPTINLVSPAILSTVPVVPVGAASLPPALPINPAPQPPKDPIPADPGNKLTPPE